MPIDADGQKQAEWRTDPARAGQSAVPRRHRRPRLQPRLLRLRAARPSEVSADLFTAVPGRRLDDNAHVLVRWTGGARGTILSPARPRPATTTTCRSHLWRQGRPRMVGATGRRNCASRPTARRPARWCAAATARPRQAGASRACRPAIPRAISRPSPISTATPPTSSAPTAPARRSTRPAPASVPDVIDGAKGIRFVEAAVASSRADGQWMSASWRLKDRADRLST